MSGFESQMGLNFESPAERPLVAPEMPENELEKREAEGRRAIGRVFPHEDLEELQLIIPDGFVGDRRVMVFLRPADTDKFKQEILFKVGLGENGEVLPEVGELKPKKQDFNDIAKRGRKYI